MTNNAPTVANVNSLNTSPPATSPDATALNAGSNDELFQDSDSEASTDVADDMPQPPKRPRGRLMRRDDINQRSATPERLALPAVATSPTARQLAQRTQSPRRTSDSVRAPKSKVGRDSCGRRKLQLLCTRGDHVEEARTLLAQGADVNDTDYAGYSALHELAIGGHVRMAEFLLDNGADVNVALNDGETPLFDAVENAFLDVVRLLVKRGADIRHLTHDGRLVFDVMKEENESTPQIRAFLKSEIKRLRRHESGQRSVSGSATPAETESPSDQGSRRNTKPRRRHVDEDAWGVNGVLIREVHKRAAEGDYAFVANYFTVSGAPTPDADTLINAARNGHDDILSVLLAMGADVNERNDQGISALHAAIGRDHFSTVKLLLDQQNANPLRPTLGGDSLLDLEEILVHYNQQEVDYIKQKQHEYLARREQGRDTKGKRTTREDKKERRLEDRERKSEDRERKRATSPPADTRKRHASPVPDAAKRPKNQPDAAKIHLPKTEGRKRPASPAPEERERPASPDATRPRKSEPVRADAASRLDPAARDAADSRRGSVASSTRSPMASPIVTARTPVAATTPDGHELKKIRLQGSLSPTLVAPRLPPQMTEAERAEKARREAESRRQYAEQKALHVLQNQQKFLNRLEERELQRQQERQRKAEQEAEEQAKEAALKQQAAEEQQRQQQQEQARLMAAENKRVWRLYPVGLRQALFGRALSPREWQRYLPLYTHTHDNRVWVMDLHVCMLTGEERLYEASPELASLAQPITADDKARLWGVYLPVFGRGVGLPRTAEAYAAERLRFLDLDVRWVRWDLVQTFLAANYPELHLALGVSLAVAAVEWETAPTGSMPPPATTNGVEHPPTALARLRARPHVLLHLPVPRYW